MPMAVTVPVLEFKLWALGIATSLLGGLLVIAYHLRQKQGVATLDLVTVAFGLLNVVLYFGFHATVVLEHMDVFIYSVLFVQVAASLFGKTPWTVQFAKRVADPAQWASPQFLAINRVTTVVWATAFFMSDASALWLRGPAGKVAPAFVLAATAFATPRIAGAYRKRLMRGLVFPVE
jgi:hypothetical protein